jgi:sulfur carrier protein ThiS
MKVTIRFYEELNDFIRKEYRKKDIEVEFKGKRSVKDLIESLGVPHVEVDLILVNGKSVDFTCLTEDGDRISVYPVFERLNIEGVQKLRDIPLRDIRFACDVHLRGLARRLRLLGFDVYYSDRISDAELVNASLTGGRVLLTCDRQLLMRKNVTKGLCIRSSGTEKQGGRSTGQARPPQPL